MSLVIVKVELDSRCRGVPVRPPQEYDSHGTDQGARDDYGDGTVDVGELQVVGVDASSLQRVIHQNGERVVHHVGQNRQP